MKIIVTSKCRIPGMGIGPISEPFEVSLKVMEYYKAVGVEFKIVDEGINPIKKTNLEQIRLPEIKKEDSIQEEIKEKIIEEPIIEEKVEEIIEEENVVEEKFLYDEESIKELTKKELKEILDKNNIEYKYADTVPVLKEKVLAIKK